MNLSTSLQSLPQLLSSEGAQRLGKRLPDIAPKALTAVLSVVIAWQLARITWMFWPQPKQPDFVPSPTTLTQSSQRLLNVQQIADAHLFGLASAEEAAGDAANAPQTNMTLVLSGTMATNDPEKGFAFVGESAAGAKFVKVGDMIAGVAKLHSVYVDKVVLDRGGRLESLNMPRSNLGGLSRLPPPVATNANPAQFAQDLRRLAQTNPSALSEIIRPQPVFSGGAQKGIRVYPGRNRQMFSSLGLQPGDLVTSVNGAMLDDPARANDILNTLSLSESVIVSVERNGSPIQLTLNTSQIHLPSVETSARPSPPPRPDADSEE
jgi:general secretion pathway protein C